MFDITQLNDVRIKGYPFCPLVNLRWSQLYPSDECLINAFDTRLTIIESYNDLLELGVFEDDAFMDYIEFHPTAQCIEVYLESEQVLIVPYALGLNTLFDEVLNDAYR